MSNHIPFFTVMLFIASYIAFICTFTAPFGGLLLLDIIVIPMMVLEAILIYREFKTYGQY